MKRVIVFIFCVLVSHNGFAQVTFSLSGAFVLSSLREKSSRTNCTIGCDKGSVAGYQAGMAVATHLGKHYLVKTGLEYSAKGGKYRLHHFQDENSQQITATSYFTTQLNYVELPVTIYYQNDANKGFRFGAGPVMGLGCKGKRKETLHTTHTEGGAVKVEKITQVYFDGVAASPETGVHLRRLEIGAGCYAGYLLPKGLVFQIQYRKGFTNLFPDKTNGSYRSSYWGAGVEYLFKFHR